MPTRRPRKAVRPDDGRLAANKPQKAKPPPSRYQQLAAGTLSVEDLTDEEVMRGRCMDRTGGFSGRPPNNFPRQLHDSIRREFVRRIESRLSETTDLAINTLIEICANKRASQDARYKSAVYLMERVMGKVPEKQIVEATVRKWEDDFAGLLVDVDDELARRRQEKTG